MPEEAPTARPAAGSIRMPLADYVRDGLALLALVVSLARPWNTATDSLQRPDVVALTFLSLCTLTLPYLARVGALPSTWTVHTTRRVRLLGNAPYFLLVLIYLVLDAVAGGPDGHDGGVGTGMALGLAGAVLAAQARQSELGPGDAEIATGRRWMAVAVIGSGIVAVLAITNVVIFLVTAGDFLGGDDIAVGSKVSIVLGAVLIVTLLAVPLLGVIRGSAGARLAMIALGATIAGALMVGSGAISAAQVESLHILVLGDSRPDVPGGTAFPLLGLLFIPAVVAVVAAPATRSVLRPTAPAQMWIDAAMRSFDLIAAIAAYVVVLSIVRLTHGSAELDQVFALAAALLMCALAVLGHIVLRNAGRGRPLALVIAALVMVLGGVLLGVLAIKAERSGFGSGAIHCAAVVGLPLFILGALTIPASVRAQFPATPRAYTWEPPAPKPVRVAPQPNVYSQQGYPHQPAAQPGHAAQPGYAAQPNAYSQQGYSHQPAAQPGHPAQPGYAAQPAAYGRVYPGAGPAPTEPLSTGTQQPPQYAPAQPGPAIPPTQQVMGFTPEQAADPSTPLEVLAQIVQDAPHLRPQVAANPSTYPALVEWLASLGDPAVNEALRSRR